MIRSHLTFQKYRLIVERILAESQLTHRGSLSASRYPLILLWSCAACSSVNEGEPCQGVTCSFHGVCVNDGTEPFCVCDVGFTARSLECVEWAPYGDIDCDFERLGQERLVQYGPKHYAIETLEWSHNLESFAVAWSETWSTDENEGQDIMLYFIVLNDRGDPVGVSNLIAAGQVRRPKLISTNDSWVAAFERDIEDGRKIVLIRFDFDGVPVGEERVLDTGDVFGTRMIWTGSYLFVVWSQCNTTCSLYYQRMSNDLETLASAPLSGNPASHCLSHDLAWTGTHLAILYSESLDDGTSLNEQEVKSALRLMLIDFDEFSSPFFSTNRSSIFVDRYDPEHNRASLAWASERLAVVQSERRGLNTEMSLFDHLGVEECSQSLGNVAVDHVQSMDQYFAVLVRGADWWGIERFDSTCERTAETGTLWGFPTEDHPRFRLRWTDHWWGVAYEGVQGEWNDVFLWFDRLVCGETCDHDADGYRSDSAACNGSDCDDLDPHTYLGAPERCNSRDDDCDTAVDEACE